MGTFAETKAHMRTWGTLVALVPVLGYEKAAAIARVAHESQRTIREVALELSGLDRPTIERLLRVDQQTEPGRAS